MLSVTKVVSNKSSIRTRMCVDSQTRSLFMSNHLGHSNLPRTPVCSRDVVEFLYNFRNDQVFIPLRWCMGYMTLSFPSLGLSNCLTPVFDWLYSQLLNMQDNDYLIYKLPGSISFSSNSSDGQAEETETSLIL